MGNQSETINATGNKKDSGKSEKFITGFKETKAGSIPVISSRLFFSDITGAWKARWGINRNNYKINPGLYCIGDPDENSIVLVSANYKLSLDSLRKELEGINAWILVLDTKGINVWCAAGKGTFGTDELNHRIISTKIRQLINHKNIILPQLGAVGVEALFVKKLTGMKVIYGPVYAKDIKEFIRNNYTKSPEMREVKFNLKDRLVLVPVEITSSLMLGLILLAVSTVFSLLSAFKFSSEIFINSIPYLGAILCGTVLAPLMLPVIPFRPFALKGFVIGIFWSVIISFLLKYSLTGWIINLLVLPPISAFLALNFTGATTYTSLTGVKLEIKFAMPLIILSVFLGFIAKILNLIKLI